MVFRRLISVFMPLISGKLIFFKIKRIFIFSPCLRLTLCFKCGVPVLLSPYLYKFEFSASRIVRSVPFCFSIVLLLGGYEIVWAFGESYCSLN